MPFLHHRFNDDSQLLHVKRRGAAPGVDLCTCACKAAYGACSQNIQTCFVGAGGDCACRAGELIVRPCRGCAFKHTFHLFAALSPLFRPENLNMFLCCIHRTLIRPSWTHMAEH